MGSTDCLVTQSIDLAGLKLTASHVLVLKEQATTPDLFSSLYECVCEGLCVCTQSLLSAVFLVLQCLISLSLSIHCCHIFVFVCAHSSVDMSPYPPPGIHYEAQAGFELMKSSCLHLSRDEIVLLAQLTQVSQIEGIWGEISLTSSLIFCFKASEKPLGGRSDQQLHHPYLGCP